MNIASWQGGLVLGTAFVIVVEVIGRIVLHRILWNRKHREHRHCEHCNGCLDPDGSGIGAVHKLVYCDICLDTAIGSVADPEKRWLPIAKFPFPKEHDRGE